MRISELTETTEVPFEPNPKIGWWKDQPNFYMVYHGTNIKNLPNILLNGLTKPDPKTGMISVTFDPHTAHGYAAMSGESDFRKAGAKAITVSHEDRVVLKIKLPKDFVEKYADPEMSGNMDRSKMTDKSKYDDWKQSNNDKPDFDYYSLSELRLSHPIDAKYIVGYMFKKPK